MRASNKFLGVLFGVFIGFTSCNRMATPPAAQLLKDAETRARDGDFLEAINLYERALDGSLKSADTHYRIALLYDDKMHDPLNALHHFKRYLTISPTGARAEEVKSFMKRDELALVTELSGDSVVSRGDAARLRNENLTLRKELDESRAQVRSNAEKPPAHSARKGKSPTPSKRSRSKPHT
jgi:tetratricopeptide (TPR) repeat protein